MEDPYFSTIWLGHSCFLRRIRHYLSFRRQFFEDATFVLRQLSYGGFGHRLRQPNWRDARSDAAQIVRHVCTLFACG